MMWWNGRWSYDLRYRMKYNIPFNSKDHRELDPYTIALQITEDDLVKSERERMKRVEQGEKLYFEDGKILIEREQNEQEIQEVFDQLNLDEL